MPDVSSLPSGTGAHPAGLPRPGAHTVIGINGQTILIDPASEIVIAQFSAWPQAGVSPERRGEDIAAFEAIIAALSP